ncbi:MAG: cytosine permease, partial [Megasphaera sp.]|nr:cytosine permease [Megasphaera sp.]
MVNERKTSAFSNGLLWFGAGISIAEILTGMLLAPLGFVRALEAIILGHVIGGIIMYLAGLIGGRTGGSAMETVRISFGTQGAKLFAGLNVIQLVGWTAVMVGSAALAANTIAAIGVSWWSIIIGAFIAWGLITALFIPSGWLPNEQLAKMVGPFLTYALPLLIAFQGGKIVGGLRGAVMGAIATVGVITGTTYTMFLGAMVMGPLAGLVIKKFDQAVDGHIKPGFEMLVNNFSVGILGMIMAIIGFELIGPVMGVILAFLTAGVQFLLQAGIFPLIGLFVEPAKVLFLNNAINHGIFTPLGAEQVAESGKSIFYMIETNPGPGAG